MRRLYGTKYPRYVTLENSRFLETILGRHCSRVGQFPTHNHSGSMNRATVQRDSWQGHWVWRTFSISKSMASFSSSPRTSPTAPPPRAPPPSRASLHSLREPSPHCLLSSIALEGNRADPQDNRRPSACDVFATKCFPELHSNFLPARLYEIGPLNSSSSFSVL